MDYKELYNDTPLVAILRGIRPENSLAIAEVIYQAGFRLIEVPFNSPDVLTSIDLLADAFADRAMIGGGTVLSPEDVDAVKTAGGTFIVSPNCNVDVIVRTKECGLTSLPGVAGGTALPATQLNGRHSIISGNDPALLLDHEPEPPGLSRQAALRIFR